LVDMMARHFPTAKAGNVVKVGTLASSPICTFRVVPCDTSPVSYLLRADVGWKTPIGIFPLESWGFVWVPGCPRSLTLETLILKSWGRLWVHYCTVTRTRVVLGNQP
jgi:hypothetical protein